MTEDVSHALIARAIDGSEQDARSVWADLGAGEGTFTFALAKLLGGTATVHAVERDRAALRTLEVVARMETPKTNARAAIVTHHVDFMRPFVLPPLSGILMANALHFVPYEQQTRLLVRCKTMLRPNGRFVLVEYDRKLAHRWGPYPIAADALPALAAEAGFGLPDYVGRTPSAFGGEMYCARMRVASAN